MTSATHAKSYILVDKATRRNYQRKLKCCNEDRSPGQRRLFRMSLFCNLVFPQRNDGLPAVARGRAYDYANTIPLLCLFDKMLLPDAGLLKTLPTVIVCTIPSCACFNICSVSPVLR